jgi:hypothetical protein
MRGWLLLLPGLPGNLRLLGRRADRRVLEKNQAGREMPSKGLDAEAYSFFGMRPAR